MNKFWFILLSLGIIQAFSLYGSQQGTSQVTPDLIYGRWSTADESIWFEFYHSGVVTGDFERGEFVGSYREVGDGNFEILKVRGGEKEMVFLRGERLVCQNRYVDFRLRKKQDYYPGTIQRL